MCCQGNRNLWMWKTLVQVLALGWLPMCCRVSSVPFLGLCSSAKIVGLDQLSSDGLSALKLSDVVSTDGKATKDNAFMQSGSTRPSPLITILQSDKIPPQIISMDAAHNEGEIITLNFQTENHVLISINCVNLFLATCICCASPSSSPIPPTLIVPKLGWARDMEVGREYA